MTDTDWMRPDPSLVERAPIDLQTDRPHSARVYDYLLGGKDNFPADREVAEADMRANPASRVGPRQNRAFLRRAVRFLAAEAGIRQFLDIGTGIPTSPNTHEVAQGVAPDSRIVYVDNDPIVLAHARALLTSSPQGRTQYIDADLLQPARILASRHLEETLDLSQPVALLLFATMHLIPDEQDPFGIVAGLVDVLVPGSYLALSQITPDFAPEAWEKTKEIAGRGGVTMRPRARADIARYFDGLDIVEPGLQVVHHWRPDPDETPAEIPDALVSMYGGVARKP
jgi:hypothetical protein